MVINSQIGFTKTRQILGQLPIIVWGLILLLIVLGIVSPNSVKPRHLLDFTRQAAPLIIVGIGQTIVMIIGGLDLSVSAVMVLVDILAAQLMADDPSRVVPVVFLCLFIGGFIGLINGLLCAKLKMPSFVVTLGMSTLLLGVTLLLCGGSPKGAIPDNFRFLGTDFIGGVLPTAAVVWLAFLAAMLFIMGLFPVGRFIRSTGVNPNAVYQAGKNHISIQILCYVICGLFSAFAGLQIAAYIGTGSLVLGDDYQMRSIAIALLGGAAFSGGKGSLVGTAIAGLFMVMMYSLVAVLNMDAGDQSIIQGVIILSGLLLNALRKTT